MRTVLAFIGYILLFGAAANGAMALAAVYFAATGAADWGASVETLMRDHTPFLMWTKPVADAILPTHVADFFFATPALVLFPVRAIVAFLLGSWALKSSRPRTA